MLLRRGAVSLVLFVLAFAGSQAAAATLGVGAGPLAGGSAVIDGCSGADVSYVTEYDPDLPGYVVSEVVVASGCASADANVSLLGRNGATLRSARPAAAAVGSVHVAVVAEN
jgi:hypothetical protein